MNELSSTSSLGGDTESEGSTLLCLEGKGFAFSVLSQRLRTDLAHSSSSINVHYDRIRVRADEGK